MLENLTEDAIAYYKLHVTKFSTISLYFFLFPTIYLVLE